MKPLLILALLLTPALAAEKPNILFIFADDHSYRAVHALGNDEIQTPNLDRLAQRGATFTHAYNMGGWSGAICVASRTMLNTGKFLWRAEKDYAETQAKFADKNLMWSQRMAAAGYDTYFTGKWHVRAKAEGVFKVARHIRAGMPRDGEEGYNRPLIGKPDPWNPADPKFGGYWTDGKHWSEVVADDATDYLDLAKAAPAPFFMYVAFNAPHDPRQSPQEYLDRYPVEKVAMPVNYVPENPYKTAMEADEKLRDEKLAPFPRTDYAVKVNRREYYAIVTHMDAQIGRILDALDASGKADNTYIFYSADHGLACGEHGLFGKQNQYEHSLRVPLFVAGPGIGAGKQIDARVYLQDIMATALDLGSAAKPDEVEFKSLQPLWRGEKDTHYEAIYGAYLMAQRSVTYGDHKLILYPKAPAALLFNVATDSRETTDLAKNPENLPLMRSLFGRLRELQKQMDDPLDLTAAFPELTGN